MNASSSFQLPLAQHRGHQKGYERGHIALSDDQSVRKFMVDIGDPVSRLDGDNIPLSKFVENDLLGGIMISGTSSFEKRTPNPSAMIPVWDAQNCTQVRVAIVSNVVIVSNERGSRVNPSRSPYLQ